MAGMRYRSKPTEVEAMQWSLDNTDTSGPSFRSDVIVAWVNLSGGDARWDGRLAVRRRLGWTYAEVGDYIVMGDATFGIPGAERGFSERSTYMLRDFYPCDPETFERRWEPA